MLSGTSWPLGPGYVNILQLVRVEAVNALDLRDDLVAAAGNIKTVDIVAAEHRGQVSADLLEIEPQVGDLVAVNDKLGLRLIHLEIDKRRKGEHAALNCLQLDLLGKGENLVRLGRGCYDELNREITASGQRRRCDRHNPDAR